MNGPEHYERAERLLAGRRHPGGSNGADTMEEALALAHIHALLAVAAAFAPQTRDWDVAR
jgi:hypothetical protein